MFAFEAGWTPARFTAIRSSFGPRLGGGHSRYQAGPRPAFGPWLAGRRHRVEGVLEPRRRRQTGTLKSGGRTPTTTWAAASRTSSRPTISVSPPKRICHVRWLRRTTFSRPGTNSSDRNVRPRRARPPMASKKPSATHQARRLSALPSPRRRRPWGPSATEARDRVRSRCCHVAHVGGGHAVPQGTVAGVGLLQDQDVLGVSGVQGVL